MGAQQNGGGLAKASGPRRPLSGKFERCLPVAVTCPDCGLSALQIPLWSLKEAPVSHEVARCLAKGACEGVLKVPACRLREAFEIDVLEGCPNAVVSQSESPHMSTYRVSYTCAYRARLSGNDYWQCHFMIGPPLCDLI